MTWNMVGAVLGGALLGAVAVAGVGQAIAQPAPPAPPGAPAGGGDAGGPGHGGWRAPWMPGGGMSGGGMPWGGASGGWPHGPWMRDGAAARPDRGLLALIYTPADRALTPQDVQQIAAAFLLWHGNRTWKVTEVAAGDDGSIGFAFATSDGSVIARFRMDRETGRVTRTG